MSQYEAITKKALEAETAGGAGGELCGGMKGQVIVHWM